MACRPKRSEAECTQAFTAGAQSVAVSRSNCTAVRAIAAVAAVASRTVAGKSEGTLRLLTEGRHTYAQSQAVGEAGSLSLFAVQSFDLGIVDLGQGRAKINPATPVKTY